MTTTRVGGAGARPGDRKGAVGAGGHGPKLAGCPRHSRETGGLWHHRESGGSLMTRKWGSCGGRPGPAILALHGGGQGAVLVGEVLPPASAPQTKPLATGPQGTAPLNARASSSSAGIQHTRSPKRAPPGGQASGATPQHRPHPRPGGPKRPARNPLERDPQSSPRPTFCHSPRALTATG